MTILIVLLIIFVLWPVIKVMWAAYSLKRRYNDAVNNAREAARQARAASRPAGWASPGKKSKVVSPSEGEYVEWEEVSVSSRTRTNHTASGKRSKVSAYITEQVTDAEWEEIS